MKNMTFKVYFNVTDLGAYGAIPGLKDAMQSELIRVYDIFADKTNSGITEQLNGEFDRLYQDYFKKNSNKEWYELTEYHRFMAEGYQKLIVDELNKSNASQLLDFYVDPEDIMLKGMLKVDHNIKIDFYMKEV